jgi:CubicO group peptidase (beta-lactamase class C family)
MTCRKIFTAAALVLCAALFLSAAQLPTAKPAEVGMSAERLDRLTRVMQEYMERGQAVGLVAMILRDGKIVYQKPFGKLDPAKGTPMPANAIFRIASQSKAVTSTAIMMLQEEGKLLIDDPVSKYIPEFAKARVAVLMTQLLPAGTIDLQAKFKTMVYQAVIESYEKR